MTNRRSQLDYHPLPEDTRHLRMFYEIYPDLTFQTEDEAFSWFEVALHVGVEEHYPSDHPRSRETLSVLMGLATFLIQRLRTHAPYGLDLSASYHSLHPHTSGACARTRLFRTISLVFSDIGPYTNREEPRILTQIKRELGLLNIPELRTLDECPQ